ncbi:MAG: AgmX/PglI C-terminal domain-containing protein [Bdellovibrionaceae bacterium]|nr:AgmX/PglI C-terminal domain-containing protein [Pseudobdellovibrionaceae bacterium]NUM58158.1 AgmX/PglI C-terminal domain-containing protein [Pseudobdellovibrionaceae bacterium]
MTAKKILYLINRQGETVRSIESEAEMIHFIFIPKTKRIEVTDNLAELEQIDINYHLLKSINKADIQNKKSIPLDFTNNELTLVFESVDILENVNLPEDDPGRFQKILKQTMTIAIGLALLIFSVDMVYRKFFVPVVTKVKELEVITVMDRKQIEKIPTVIASNKTVSLPNKRVNKIQIKKKIKTAIALRTSPSPRKTIQISQLGALGVLGSLKKSNQNGGLNLNRINTSKGIGMGGSLGSGGVQTTNYAKGLFAAPLGVGNKAEGAGGYGTKGKGGGQAGYGKMTITGNYGSSITPLYEEAFSEGGLDRNAIAAVIARHLSEVRFCYESALQQKPNLNGRVSMKFIINPRGDVATAQVGSSSLAHPQVEGCIREKLKSWKFPQPQGGVNVKVSYPFVLKRVSDS